MRTICCVFLFSFYCGRICPEKYSCRTDFPDKALFTKPDGNGITVSWLTHVPVYSWVEYGTDTLELERKPGRCSTDK